MPRAIVLGGGLVGSVMAGDMAESGFDVAVADVRDDVLARAAAKCGNRKVQTIKADLADASAIARIVEPFDIVLGALPSSLGFNALKTVIEAGRGYCDISFMAEDPLELNDLAKERGVTAVVDCGVAPGMSNLLAGHGFAMLDRCTNIEIYVGGLPRERSWPFEYKAGFSPYDVIQEYTRPSRIVEDGRIVVREALSEPELMDFGEVGTLEAFNTDGLRSLVSTLDVPSMKEKTLRYPGHIELMRVFRETGLFSHEPIDVNGTSVRPIDVISSLMFPMWQYGPGEEDLTVMRVIVEGERNGEMRRHTWDLVDFFDQASGNTSMSRATALPCTIIGRMIASGELSDPGVHVPELLGQRDGFADRMLEVLAARDINYRHTEQVIEAV